MRLARGLVRFALLAGCAAITTTVEVHTCDHVELVVDGTKDRFRDGSIETLASTGLRESRGFPEGMGCEPTG